MTTREDAIAELAEDVGRALLAFAERLREEGTAAPRSPTAATHSRQLGKSQQKVVGALQAAGDTGATSTEVARATGISATNTPRMLKALRERGLAEATDETPTIWRMVTPDH